jgi:hypothetical protein
MLISDSNILTRHSTGRLFILFCSQSYVYVPQLETGKGSVDQVHYEGFLFGRTRRPTQDDTWRIKRLGREFSAFCVRRPSSIKSSLSLLRYTLRVSLDAIAPGSLQALSNLISFGINVSIYFLPSCLALLRSRPMDLDIRQLSRTLFSHYKVPCQVGNLQFEFLDLHISLRLCWKLS